MRESKIKHTLGLIHSALWIFAFFYVNEKRNTDALLKISIGYYLQDTIWSFNMKQYFVIVHHMCVSFFWYFLIRDEPTYLYGKNRSLLFAPMFLAELSAAFIHLKHIIIKPITHHICMILFVITRLVLFPIEVLPLHYQIMMTSDREITFLLGGFILNLFVVLFSIATIIMKWKTFRLTFRWLFFSWQTTKSK
jgi:hypothetical protein